MRVRKNSFVIDGKAVVLGPDDPPERGPTLNIRDYQQQFEKMSIDELWALRLQIDGFLATTMAAKREELERWLEQLRPTTGPDDLSEDSSAHAQKSPISTGHSTINRADCLMCHRPKQGRRRI
jgi:hypothetical protein